jgi:flagellar M-ring protein FliF
MAWNDYWGALSSSQRVGLGAGALLVVALTVALAIWLWRDPYVRLADGLEGERLNEIVLELSRQELSFRVADSGEAVSVPRSELGRARAVLAADEVDAPPSVGLELFKETDFSTTDFAQRINYQRALQGEITRTVQSILGVRSARVHVTLADSGLFKREAAKATAAVTVTMMPGRSLTAIQVAGIQRLVAAAVPKIETDDVVVLDESGASLTRVAAGSGNELSTAHLELKRQADQYFEGKLRQLLRDLLPPAGAASLSVDASLDERQLRVTTEEPIAVRSGKDPARVAGVLVRERQSQRGRAAGLVHTDSYADEGDSSDWEYEYKVGNRIEQMVSAPGAIKRISVAVAVQGAPAELSAGALEQLVANAIGMDKARGDSVAVWLMPASQEPVAVERVASKATPFATSHEAGSKQVGPDTKSRRPAVVLLVAFIVLLVALMGWAWTRKRVATVGSVDEDVVADRIRQWLGQGGAHERN